MNAGELTDLDPKAAIHWGDLHRRVAEGIELVQKELEDDPLSTAQILRERARALAGETIRMASPEDIVEIVEFLAAHERYAVEIRFAREIHALRAYAPVPGAPPFLLGVVHLRGEMLSVVDLKRLFDLPDRGLTELDRVIVLQGARDRLGLLANAVQGVRRLPRANFLPPPRTLTGIRGDFAQGVTADGLVLLNTDRFLGHPLLRLNES